MKFPFGVSEILPHQANNSIDSASVFNSNLHDYENFKITSLIKPKMPFTFISQPLMKKFSPISQNIKSAPYLKTKVFNYQSKNYPPLKMNHDRSQQKLKKRNYNYNYSSTPNITSKVLELPIESIANDIKDIPLDHQPIKTPIDEKFCKICFENFETKNTGKLINPCKCTGTVRFIHEECLKTWQVSQKKDIKNAECELCHCKYSMKFSMGLKFYPRQAIEDGLLSFISSLCLFILIATLISIIIIFAIQLNTPQGIFSNNKKDDTGTAYKLGILISCCVICFILTILFILSLKEACFISKVKKWAIFNYVEGLNNKLKDKSSHQSTYKSKIPKILPRSSSDNSHVKIAEKKQGNDIQIKIIDIDIKSKKKNLKKHEDLMINVIHKDIIQSQIKAYHRNLIKFPQSNSDVSEKSSIVHPFVQRKDYQKNLVNFSNNSSEKNLNTEKQKNSKPELLKLSSLNSSNSSVSLDVKIALSQKFAKHLPKEYLNLHDNKEKTIGVIMNQKNPNGNISQRNMLMEFLQRKDFLSKKTTIYSGVKKSFYLFKKQSVFNEEKIDESKQKISTSSVETKKKSSIMKSP